MKKNFEKGKSQKHKKKKKTAKTGKNVIEKGNIK